MESNEYTYSLYKEKEDKEPFAQVVAFHDEHAYILFESQHGKETIGKMFMVQELEAIDRVEQKLDKIIAHFKIDD